MFDHDGTYMRAIALQQQNAQIIVEAMTDYDEDLAGKFTAHVYQAQAQACSAAAHSELT